MDSPRWWNVAVGAIATVLSVILVTETAGTPWRLILGLSAIAVFAAGWYLIGRRAWSQPRAGVVYTVIIILSAGAACAAFPSMAIIQSVAYPLVWVLSASLRAAMVGNVALASSVGVGFFLSLDATAEALLQTLLTVALSLGVSIALGLWITRISDLSEDRRGLIESLESTREQLAIVSRDAGIASERARLARDIHDTIAQDLTGVVMMAQQAQRDLRTGGAQAIGQQLAALEESARAALAESRSLVASHAAVVDAGDDVVGALTRLAERFTRETSVAVTVEAGALPPLPRDTEVVLLRSAQESLANIRKHAHASRATITLTELDGVITLRVRDDGDGFDVDEPSHGFGLGGMRDRLALVGGAVAVVSSREGTTLTASLPLVSA